MFSSFLRNHVKTSLKTQVYFVFEKPKIAPMKPLLIQKLELQASLLATRLAEDIHKALASPVSNMFMWTDCNTLLQWLNSYYKQPTFIRVNHADTRTRGILAEPLKASSWENRPSQLKNCEWPFKPSIE